MAALYPTPEARPSARAQAVKVLLMVAGVVLVLWVSASIGGCAREHGKYTSEGIQKATTRIEALKAATEYQMAEEAFNSADLDKALKHCEKSIKLSDKVARTWTLRGRIMLEKNQLQDAVSSLQKAAEIDGNFVLAHYYLGIVAERIDRKDEALDHYLKASELDTNSAQYVVAAAEMMIDTDQTDRAEQYLLSKQKSFQHTAGVQQSLGQISMMRGDYPQAEIYFNEARLLAPDEGEVLEDLARAQYLQSKYAECDSNLTRLLKIADFAKRRDLQHMRARCLVSLERNAEARDILVALTKDEAGTNDVEAWIALGQVAYQIRDTSRLRLAFTRVIALAPSRPEGHVLKGLHQRRMGDFTNAEVSLKKAVELAPTAENHVLLGLTQERLGKGQLARASFKSALDADPKDPIARQLVDSPRAAALMAGVPEGQ